MTSTIPNVPRVASNFMMRKRWDDFTQYLLGAEPPMEFVIGAGGATGRGGRGGGL
jgi:hypothetical protein